MMANLCIQWNTQRTCSDFFLCFVTICSFSPVSYLGWKGSEDGGLHKNVTVKYPRVAFQIKLME